MTEDNRTYIAIDLKSFFASVECVERGLDPLTTNLVVADVSRTEKTICLAVSPSLKALHIPESKGLCPRDGGCRCSRPCEQTARYRPTGADSRL